MFRAVTRLFNRASVLRGSLLNVSEVGDDVELTPSDAVLSSVCEGDSFANVKVEKMRCTSSFIVIVLVMALVIPSFLVLHVVAESWHMNPSGRYWLIMGLGFYIVSAIRAVYEALSRQLYQLHFLRVEIRRSSAATVFEAVSASLAEQAELSGETCSWDVEVGQEHDSVTGAFSVIYRFWGTQPRGLHICVTEVGNAVPGQQLSLHVTYDPGTDIMCSRSGRMTSQATIVLSTRISSASALWAKALLSRWLQASYQKFTNPIQGVVKIFALQQSSTDWVPEWKLERVKPCKSVVGTGQSFYLERDILHRLLVDAKLWSGRSLRVYMLSGPPGVGKSEFILWLASQLALPVYRLSLSSRSLSDNLLAQLLSQTSIVDSKVLIQVDEVQETLNRWRDVASAGVDGVSAGGFCESIQGSTAMRCGVVVLSGTPEILHEDIQLILPAVYRRIHCTARLTWLALSDVGLYFKNFLCSFVSGASELEWNSYQVRFLREGPWAGDRQISIDMLQQYFMASITEASLRGIGKFIDDRSASFQVSRERHEEFFSLICDPEAATSFLDAYAFV